MKDVKAVRWMGAYTGEGYFSNLENAIWWEITQQEREVAFAFQRPATKVGDSIIGLLVDLEKSSVRARYSGDAWTFNEDGRLVNKRSYRVPLQPGVVPNITKHEHRENPYDEAVGKLVFKGVVVHRSATKQDRKWAAAVAARVGLPYLGTLNKDT